jgi:hypothetical protein
MLFRGSKSRNKVSVGEPAEGSLTNEAQHSCSFSWPGFEQELSTPFWWGGWFGLFKREQHRSLGSGGVTLWVVACSEKKL